MGADACAASRKRSPMTAGARQWTPEPQRGCAGKWSRVLRYAEIQKDQKEPLAEFVKRKGGITNVMLGTVDASGDVPGEGGQSGLFSAERQASEKCGSAGYQPGPRCARGEGDGLDRRPSAV
jgi:hypothetical protein